MKLVIGLGNPGKDYERTWHNAGFLALDKLADELGTGKFKTEKKFSTETAAGKLGREKVILAKPQTFMNESGRAVAAMLKFYKLSVNDLLVIHDDIDLPLGKLRIAKDSSAGGHNGIKSIISSVGSQDFLRIKMGVRTEVTDKMKAADYVLKKINLKDFKYLQEEIDRAVQAAVCAMAESPTMAMNKFN